MSKINKLSISILIILLISLLIILLITLLITFKKNDSFELQQNIPQTTNQSFERTILYGSLLLDKINEVIINMTDPPINYDTKRIEINKYSDVLL